VIPGAIPGSFPIRESSKKYPGRRQEPLPGGGLNMGGGAGHDSERDEGGKPARLRTTGGLQRPARGGSG